MLAIEPTAQIDSSLGANPGVFQKGGFPVGQPLDLDPFIVQPVIKELSLAFTETCSTMAQLKGSYTPAVVNDLIAKGFVKGDPPNGFRVIRKLRILYPARVEGGEQLKGSGRLPLVVLLHGRHDIWDGAKHIPNHEGYTFLQRELAAWGIVSVSVDANAANFTESSRVEMRAKMVLGALDAMREMDEDAGSRFYRRLDFNRVGLMGHSRGGDAVVRAAILNKPQANKPSHYKIRAVCSVAPTDFTGLASTTKGLTRDQAPFYAVIYGALDGDVSGYGGATDSTGTGFRHYDRANTDKAMLFLDGCCHNRFNDVWTNEDYDMLAGDISVSGGRVLSREAHRTILNEYVGGLFRWHLLGRQAPKSLFDGTTTNSVGAEFSVQWSFGKKVVVLDDFEGASGATQGTRTLSPEATVGPMLDVNGTLTINSTAKIGGHTNHYTGVLVVAQSAPASEVYRLDLPPAQKDWSGYDQLIFRVCADADVSSAASISLSDLPDFTLVFTDEDNESRQVGVAALLQRGRLRRPVFHDITKGRHCTAIRLETLAFDLADLSAGQPALDRKRMKSLALIPGSLPRQQFFDSLELVRR